MIKEAKKKQRAQIVVIDDEPEMLSLISDYLSSQHYQVYAFSNTKDAKEFLDKNDTNHQIHLILSDVYLPGMTGIELMKAITTQKHFIPTILMTAFGSVESAVESMRNGAFDYIVKPLKLNELGIMVERAIEFGRLRHDNDILRKKVKDCRCYGNILGKSPKMLAIFEIIERVAQTSANVLIMGETGTGKEMVARSLHNAGSRANKPFIAINCAAIPKDLLESELFGHLKGAFTGASQAKNGLFDAAHEGTLFLDEIGDMSFDLQTKLLRVLQERRIRPLGETQDHKIDVRVIAATHKDLKTAIKTQEFREDLYYRLSVIPITLPPLRERQEDIIDLMYHFLQKYNEIYNLKKTGFSAEALNLLQKFQWPGNVRELENAIERAVVLSQHDEISASDILPYDELLDAKSFLSNLQEELPTLKEMEEEYTKYVLLKVKGKKEKAAQILGINRRTLCRKKP